MLTDTTIRNAKPRERPYKLGDSRGLYLIVTPRREVVALRLPLRR